MTIIAGKDLDLLFCPFPEIAALRCSEMHSPQSGKRAAHLSDEWQSYT